MVNIPIFDSYVSNGLVQPPTRITIPEPFLPISIFHAIYISQVGILWSHYSICVVWVCFRAKVQCFLFFKIVGSFFLQQRWQQLFLSSKNPLFLVVFAVFWYTTGIWMVRFYTPILTPKQPTFIASRGWMRLEVPTEKDVFFLAFFFWGGGGRKGTSMLFGLYWDTCYKTRWWFQIFRYFLFSPLFREDSHFDEYFSNGLVQPPTSRPLGYTELLLQKVNHDFYLPANNPCRMTDLRASINRDLSQNQFFIPNNFQTASPATVCFF